MTIDEGTKTAVRRLIRASSHSRLQLLSEREGVHLDEILPEPLVYGHWMSFVLLSGKNLRIIFKAHFMSEASRFFAAKFYRAPADTIKTHQAVDFMKEFCNLTAGQIKVDLSHSGVKVGVSLPGLTRGFDEVFYKPPKDSVRDIWCLRWGDMKVNCTADIEIFDAFAVKDTPITDSSGSGHVEYL